MREYDAAATPEQRLRATLMVVYLWQWQINEASGVVTRGFRDWSERRDTLVQQVGRARAQQIATNDLTPRVEALKQALTAMGARLEGRGD
jgi:hypothetical protein